MAEWHTEADVQASLVTALAVEGWRSLSVVNTATEEHGSDLIDSRDACTFPSRSTASSA
jgi:hypothetical protein